LSAVKAGLNQMTDSLHDLETMQIKVAFLEDTLSKLSDEFYRQQRDLDNLKSQYLMLVNKLQGLQNNSSGGESSQDERPPHY